MLINLKMVSMHVLHIQREKSQDDLPNINRHFEFIRVALRDSKPVTLVGYLSNSFYSAFCVLK